MRKVPKQQPQLLLALICYRPWYLRNQLNLLLITHSCSLLSGMIEKSSLSDMLGGSFNTLQFIWNLEHSVTSVELSRCWMFLREIRLSSNSSNSLIERFLSQIFWLLWLSSPVSYSLELKTVLFKQNFWSKVETDRMQNKKFVFRFEKSQFYIRFKFLSNSPYKLLWVVYDANFLNHHL